MMPARPPSTPARCTTTRSTTWSGCSSWSRKAYASAGLEDLAGHVGWWALRLTNAKGQRR